jgi:hypothetical protein
MGIRRVFGEGDAWNDSISMLLAAIYYLKIPAFKKILLFPSSMKYFRLPGIEHPIWEDGLV